MGRRQYWGSQLCEALSSTTSIPTNKQKRKSGASVLKAMLEKGAALQEFQMDITWTFSATNIPLEKLGHPEMEKILPSIWHNTPWSIPTITVGHGCQRWVLTNGSRLSGSFGNGNILL